MRTKINVLAKKFISLVSLLTLFSLGVTLLAPGTALAAACSPTTTFGTDTMTVNVPASGTYYIWSRVLDPTTAVNSIDLQVNGSTCFAVGGSANVTANSWTWVNYASGNTSSPISTSLTAGNNTFEYIGTEGGIGLASLLLTQDPSCVPSGTGTNCITTTTTPPTAPTNVKATANSATSATVTWSASTDTGGPGLGGYYVLRGGTKVATVSASTTSYSDTSLAASTTYSYTVEAYDSSSPPLVSSASGAASVTTPSASTNKPSTPTNVKATANSTTSATVTWTASTDTGGPGLGGYDVLLDGSKVASVGASTTTYTDTSLAANTTYSFTIEAYDTSSTPVLSSASAAASVTTPSAATVSVPYYLQAGGSGFTDSVTGVVWHADQYYTQDNTFGSSGGVAKGGDGSACTTSLADSNCTTHAIAGTTDQKPYQTERWGNFHYDIPVANGKYTVVLKLAEINPPSSGSRTFNVTIDGTSELSSYNVSSAVGNYTADDQSFQASVTNGDLNITFVTVSDSAKVSAIEVLPASTVQPPTAPTNLKATLTSSNTVSLTWTASTDSGGPGLGGYAVFRQLGTGAYQALGQVSATTTSYTDTTPAASTAYNYEVIAFDKSSPALETVSSPVSITTGSGGTQPQPPSVPAGVVAKANSPTSVTVTWNASTDTGATVASYLVFRNGVEINGVKGGTASTFSYTDPTAQANTTYQYQVEAENSASQTSGLSAAAGVTTPKQTSTGPTTPQGLTGAASGSSQVNLAWHASSSTAGVASYLVYENGNQVASVTTTSYGVTGLKASTTYSFYVIAVDTNGLKSGASNTVSVTTGAVKSSSATLEGVVENSAGKPLANIKVVSGAHASATGRLTANTNSKGQFAMAGLTPNVIHSFTFSGTNYKQHTYDWRTPAGVTLKIVKLKAL